MDKQQLMEVARKDPRFEQGAQILGEQLGKMGATPEMLQELATTLEFVLDHPEQYPQVRAAAIQKGFASEQDIPEEFNPTYVISLLLAVYAAQDKLAQQPAFAQGGLASYGRGGDTMLAHVNPMEAEVLRRMGGSGSANPNTGVIEFKGGGLGSILSVVAPIALNFFAPGLGAALGGGLMGAIGTGAIAGGVGSALGGGDFMNGALQGGITGGMGAGLGDMVGGAAKGALGSFGEGMGQAATNALGGSLVGGITGAVTGQGFGQGMARGALGSLAEQATSGMGVGMQAAGKSAGNLLTAGASPQDALIGGGLAGLATSMSNKSTRPSETVAKGLSPSGSVNAGLSEMGGGQGLTGSPSYSLTEMGGAQGVQSGLSSLTTPKPSGFSFGNVTAKQMLSATPAVLALLGTAQTPEQVAQTATQMSPEQREYFDRASQHWDWDRLKSDASAKGMGLGQYMAANWNTITADNAYVKPTPTKLAQGGLGMLASGGGSGRDDIIDARLSDGEYVFDAETTALLGDGSVKEGARRLDQMRESIRRHKGKSLSKGKISPNAKSPLAYLKEVA